MPRRPTYSKKSVTFQVEKLERKCRYCKTHRNAQGFDKHEAWCKRTWIIRRELRELRAHSMANQLHIEATPIPPKIPSSSDANNEFVEGSSSMSMEVEYPSPALDPQGMLTLSSSLRCLFLMFTGISQTLWPCSDLIYRGNTLRLFPIPILQIQRRK